MTDREKLIELIREVKHTCRQVECWDCKIYVLEGGNCQAEPIADHLISKGVTIPVRCEECKWFYVDDERGLGWCTYYSGNFEVSKNGFCYRGERREVED